MDLHKDGRREEMRFNTCRGRSSGEASHPVCSAPFGMGSTWLSRSAAHGSLRGACL